ncbi:hypothetical protein [Segetibacter koreensis]|uniref:hypothetical protein n=1 Tax=Segetibacter koreensis TaxID=398037 RepID=UPI000377A6A5|nr:hypothetical protein [Segetibacter koreensis]
MKRLLGLLTLIACLRVYSQPIAEIGKPLQAWKEGYLDLHHINTGRGNAAFYILPDGTTVLFDAGELDPTNARTTSKRNAVIRPNDSKHPYEWIVNYIRKVSPLKEKAVIDYAVISHFHDDHFGSWYVGAPLSETRKYVLTGITGVGELIPIHRLLQRDYNYPVAIENRLKRFKGNDDNYIKTWNNYISFIKAQQQKGMQVIAFKAGAKSQITLLRHPLNFRDFNIQNIKSNGLIWTGKDTLTEQHFPVIDTADPKSWPDENTLSNVMLIHYGPFTYYTGGDCSGNVFAADATWRDVETPAAKVIGEVDVATMDHHGNRDAVNEFQVKTFKPRVWIEQTWTADHPGHEVLIRATSPYLYEGKRDLFATNMLEPNKLVIGPLVDQSYRSQQGHIVVRVLPGGKNYYVIILDDTNKNMLVKNIFGPYTSKHL